MIRDELIKLHENEQILSKQNYPASARQVPYKSQKHLKQGAN